MIRSTVPSTGAVIEASIFIASMVATVSPARHLVALRDSDRHHALERRRHVPYFWFGSAFSAASTSAATDSSRMLTGRSCPLRVAHHHPVAALVRFADRR